MGRHRTAANHVFINLVGADAEDDLPSNAHRSIIQAREVIEKRATNEAKMIIAPTLAIRTSPSPSSPCVSAPSSSPHSSPNLGVPSHS